MGAKLKKQSPVPYGPAELAFIRAAMAAFVMVLDAGNLAAASLAYKVGSDSPRPSRDRALFLQFCVYLIDERDELGF